MNHPIGVRRHGRERVAPVPQLAVRVVLHDPHPVPPCQLGHPRPPCRGQRPPGRVRERRHQVDQLRPFPREHLGERVRVDPVGVRGHRHDPCPGHREALQRRQICRLLDHHGGPRIQQGRRDQRQRLLRPGRDQHVLSPGRQSPGAHPGREVPAQPQVTLGRRVLQMPARGRPGQGGVERRPPAVDVEQLRRGQPTGERDHLRPVDQSEKVTHGGGGDSSQTHGKGPVPSRDEKACGSRTVVPSTCAAKRRAWSRPPREPNADQGHDWFPDWFARRATGFGLQAGDPRGRVVAGPAAEPREHERLM